MPTKEGRYGQMPDKERARVPPNAQQRDTLRSMA